ncbi:MAG: TfoX/Sxy family protein [Pseudorhodoplanes sp.]
MDADFIRDLFSSFRPVDIRRMFGGAGIYADGVMFALLSSGGTIYLKIDEGNEPDFDRENLPHFAPTTKNGRHAVMPYRQMPDRLYDDPDELAQWATKALRAATSKATRRQPQAAARTSRKNTARKKTARKKTKSR